MQGRTHRPEVSPELCGTCGICRGACPGRIFEDLSLEEDSTRGRLSKHGGMQDLLGSSPCRAACPLGQDISGYMRCLSLGDAEGALARILEDNPFPAVLGHVCHHPCERACAGAPLHKAPAIRELKRFASMARRPAVKVKQERSGAKVAIVGSGPAGLSAAWALAREGVRVTVYEAQPLAGGLPAWAIPSFRLPRKALAEDVAYILRHGVALKLNSPVTHQEVLRLRSENDAVILACGAPQARRVDLPGNMLPRVWLGLDFLRRAALGPPPDIRGPVVVVGGGNAAVDSARWAVRRGSPVILMYRREREQMPAYAEEIEQSAGEGIQFLFRAQPVAFEGGPRKGVRRVRYQATMPSGSGRDGRLSFVPVAGSEKAIAAGTVILALGQGNGWGGWAEALGLPAAGLCESGPVAPRLYAAGDMAIGPATIAEAVGGGIQCARSILGEVLR